MPRVPTGWSSTFIVLAEHSLQRLKALKETARKSKSKLKSKSKAQTTKTKTKGRVAHSCLDCSSIPHNTFSRLFTDRGSTQKRGLWDAFEFCACGCEGCGWVDEVVSLLEEELEDARSDTGSFGSFVRGEAGYDGDEEDRSDVGDDLVNDPSDGVVGLCADALALQKDDASPLQRVETVSSSGTWHTDPNSPCRGNRRLPLTFRNLSSMEFETLSATAPSRLVTGRIIIRTARSTASCSTCGGSMTSSIRRRRAREWEEEKAEQARRCRESRMPYNLQAVPHSHSGDYLPSPPSSGDNGRSSSRGTPLRTCCGEGRNLLSRAKFSTFSLQRETTPASAGVPSGVFSSPDDTCDGCDTTHHRFSQLSDGSATLIGNSSGTASPAKSVRFIESAEHLPGSALDDQEDLVGHRSGYLPSLARCSVITQEGEVNGYLWGLRTSRPGSASDTETDSEVDDEDSRPTPRRRQRKSRFDENLLRSEQDSFRLACKYHKHFSRDMRWRRVLKSQLGLEETESDQDEDPDPGYWDRAFWRTGRL
ncbi:MAG: hypothetical protein M1817_003149 [Caeruleum heppii]|nr:MAG: hypothetical protein M1817_003149 [Caeruleum heppii]